MLHTTHLLETADAPFHFESTALAHGWWMLQPFSWDELSATLGHIQRLPTGPVVRLHLRQAGSTHAPQISITVESAAPLTVTATKQVSQNVRRMLRLDEDFSDFYRLQTTLAHHPLTVKPGGGRLLRCPTLFEDLVYTLCTTNISWSGTRRMVANLTDTLGEPLPGQPEQRAFPMPAAIVQAGADFLRRETGLGYRSDYVWQLASAVADGRLDPDKLQNDDRPTKEIYKKVRRLKGFGDYAASTVLMLLGRYDRLAIDSALRSFVTNKYFNGQPPPGEQEIRAIYEPWGRWRYLAYWFDAPPDQDDV